MEIPINSFKPKNNDEYICLQIAKSLWETDMRFILSRLSKYGVHLIEEAYGIIKEMPSSQIRNKRRYFNKLIDKLAEAQERKDH